MKALKRLLIFITVVIYSTSLLACASNDKTSEKNSKKDKGKIKIYTDLKDRYSLDILKFAVDEYMKENSKIEVTISNSMYKNGIMEDMNKEKDIDMVYTTRSTLINLNRNGLVQDLSNAYTKNKMDENYYKVVANYGNIGGKYYGMAIIPYTLEIIYNQEALKKNNLMVPTSLKEAQQLFSKLNEKSIKIPVLVNEDIEPLMAFSSIIASNIIDNSQLEKLYDSGKDKYEKYTNIQDLFNEINTLKKDSVIKADTFEKGNESAINKIDAGESPVALVLSYFIEDLKNPSISILKEFSLSDTKFNMPVVVNGLLSISSNSKNSEAAGDFLKFIFSDKFQEKLVSKGLITGNKKVNEKLSEKKKPVAEHLEKANINNIMYFYDLPSKVSNGISIELEKVLKNGSDGKEWSRVLENVYK